MKTFTLRNVLLALLGFGAGSLIYIASAGSGFNPDPRIVNCDAEFIAYVNRAGGPGQFTNTEITAGNNLVLNLKSEGLYWNFYYFYPLMGSGTQARAQNLIGRTFVTGSSPNIGPGSTFNSGTWALAFGGINNFSRFGWRPDGKYAYAETGFYPRYVNAPSADNTGIYSFSWGFYLLNNFRDSQMGYQDMDTYNTGTSGTAAPYSGPSLQVGRASGTGGGAFISVFPYYFNNTYGQSGTTSSGTIAGTWVASLQTTGTNLNYANQTVYHSGDGLVLNNPDHVGVGAEYIYKGQMVFSNSYNNYNHADGWQTGSNAFATFPPGSDSAYMCFYCGLGMNVTQESKLDTILTQFKADRGVRNSTSLITTIGDSIATGNFTEYDGYSNTTNGYSAFLINWCPNLGGSEMLPDQCANFSGGGNTLSVMSGTTSSGFSSSVISSIGNGGIFMFDGGINDLQANPSISLATLEGYIKTICFKARTAGATKIVYFNVLPSDYFVYGSPGDATRLAFNAWIADTGTGGGRQYVDTLIDQASLFTSGTTYNLTNFALSTSGVYNGYHVHPNNTAEQIIFGFINSGSAGW